MLCNCFALRNRVPPTGRVRSARRRASYITGMIPRVPADHRLSCAARHAYSVHPSLLHLPRRSHPLISYTPACRLPIPHTCAAFARRQRRGLIVTHRRLYIARLAQNTPHIEGWQLDHGQLEAIRGAYRCAVADRVLSAQPRHDGRLL